MARPSITDIRALPDVASVIRWNFVMVSAPAGVTAPAAGLNIRCETSTIPKATNQTFDLNIRGHKVVQNGILQYDSNMTLTFIETVDNMIHSFFKSWREQMWATRTGVSAAPTSQLKGEFILQRLDNQDKPIWNYQIHGLLLQDYDVGSLDGTSSDGIKPTLIFAYDFFDDGPA